MEEGATGPGSARTGNPKVEEVDAEECAVAGLEVSTAAGTEAEAADDTSPLPGEILNRPHAALSERRKS